MAVMTVRPRRNLSSNTDRHPSANIWFDCPWHQIKSAEFNGIADEDDFIRLWTEDGSDDEYQKYIDTGNTIRLAAASTTVYGGVLQMVTDASDNDGPVVQRHTVNAGSSALGPFFLGNTSGAAFKFWFECRIKKSSITDNQAAMFVGLAQVGRAADNGILEDDTGDIVDSISAIGFRVKHDNGEELDFAYQDAAQTAPTEAIANMTAMVADTYIKLGFKYDPAAPSTQKIKIYVNGQAQSTYITTALMDAAAFPENDALAVCFGLKNGEATATTLSIDWWKAAQMYSN